MTGNFGFLPADFSAVAESASKAEGHIMGDPQAACSSQGAAWHFTTIVLKYVRFM